MVARAEILQNLLPQMTRLRKACAELGHLLCQSNIPPWRILDLHGKWDAQNFCSHLDETLRLLKNKVPIPMVSTSLRLKQDFSDFQQFQKDLSAAVEPLPSHNTLRNKLGSVDGFLKSYIRGLIGHLKLLKLHTDKRLEKWITEFEGNNPEQIDPSVADSLQSGAPKRAASDSPKEEPATKKRRPGEISPDRENLQAPIASEAPGKVSKRAVDTVEIASNGNSDEQVHGAAAESSLDELKKGISNQISALKSECEIIYKTLSVDFSNQRKLLCNYTNSWKPLSFLEWLSKVDRVLFTEDFAKFEGQVADALQKRKIMFERFFFQIRSTSLLQAKKDRINTLARNLVTSLNKITVTLMQASYANLLL